MHGFRVGPGPYEQRLDTNDFAFPGFLPPCAAMSTSLAATAGPGFSPCRHRPSWPRSRPAISRMSLRQGAAWVRSEEHTSELQSHLNLVCRLLLEKKKKSPGKARPHSTQSCPAPPQ